MSRVSSSFLSPLCNSCVGFFLFFPSPNIGSSSDIMTAFSPPHFGLSNLILAGGGSVCMCVRDWPESAIIYMIVKRRIIRRASVNGIMYI